VGRDGVGGLLSLWGQNENSADEAQDAERGDRGSRMRGSREAIAAKATAVS
jgi:hypothetical protein